MSSLLVAIVGRPNVGKSTLFNRLVGRRVAIVEQSPGVTRDRIYGRTEWLGVPLVVIDTGGLDFSDKGTVAASVRAQAQVAIDEADVILFVVDSREGVTSNDLEQPKRCGGHQNRCCWLPTRWRTTPIPVTCSISTNLDWVRQSRSRLHGQNVGDLSTKSYL